MRTIFNSGLVLVLFLVLSSCEAPPPGTVVFDGKNNPDDVVMEYHGFTKDDLDGHKVLKVETKSLRNPDDTTSGVTNRLGTYADFE